MLQVLLIRNRVAGFRRLRKHVLTVRKNHNRRGSLFPSPGKAKDSAGSGMGVSRHVGCHINDVVDLGKQGHHSARLRKSARASGRSASRAGSKRPTRMVARYVARSACACAKAQASSGGPCEGKEGKLRK